MLLILGMVVPFALVTWWSSRSQKKAQAAMLTGLQKGDRIVLQGGLIGRLAETGERTIKVEIASGVKVEFQKSSIIGKDGGDGTIASGKK